MLKVSNSEYAALLRTDFQGFIEASFCELNPVTPFLDNWHLSVLAFQLERVRLGEITRLIINMPPRSLKSHCGSVAFPAWLLGKDPSARIICASYAQDLSDKLARDCRTLMMSSRYKTIFPQTQLASNRPSLQELVTSKGGFRFSTSIGGGVTGRGADYLVIDDPLKPDQAASEVERKNVNEWFGHTLLSRLNDKRTGRIVVIMQRLHEDDLTGYLLEKEGWASVRFPAIAEEDETFTIRNAFGKSRTYFRKQGEVLHPEREDLATLESIKTSLGSYNFAGQYQQSPAPQGGGMIKEKWAKRYSVETRPSRFDSIFQSWDTANKVTELSDYSVCTTWGRQGRNLYLLHVYRKQMDYPALKRAVIDQRRVWEAGIVIIEDKASGTQLIQELMYERFGWVRGYQPKPNQDKIMRMYACCSLIENGMLYLPEKADWLDDYIKELTMFPNGKHDDQVDSTSQAIDWIQCTYWNYRGVTISEFLI